MVQKILGFRNPVHPVRVKKAATPTHIIPLALKDKGFEFKFDFEASLSHWQWVAPEDFDGVARPVIEKTRPTVQLKRGPEVAPREAMGDRKMVPEEEMEIVS